MKRTTLFFWVFLVLASIAFAGKTLDNLRLDTNTISSVNTNGDIILDPAGTGGVQLTDETASEAVYLDANKEIRSKTGVSDTELGYLSTVTSDIQTQLDSHTDSFLIQNLGLKSSAGAASAMKIELKQSDATTDPTSASPVLISTPGQAGTGYVTHTETAAMSTTVPSGATLGTASGQAHWVYVYYMDFAGTGQLCVSLTLFDQGSLQSATILNTGSDSGLVLYCPSAATSEPIRLIGRVAVSQATAGVWSSGTSETATIPFDLGAVHFAAGTDSVSVADVTTQDIIFEDVFHDPLNIYDETTGTATINKKGTWSFFCAVELQSSANWSVGEQMAINIQQNGATRCGTHIYSHVTATILMANKVSCSLEVAYNDSITCEVYQNSGAAISVSTSNVYNYFTGHFIGRNR